MSRDDVEADITLREARLTPGGKATLRLRTTVRAPVKIRGAHAHFAGYEETKAVYRQSTGKTTTTHTATERNVLVEERKTFQGRAPAGFFHNLADGALTLLGGGDHEELRPGSHEVVLEVDLPQELPGSFEAKKAKIVYEAGIHLDIPAGRDFRRTVTFAVPAAPVPEVVEPEPVTIRYPEDSGRGFFDSLFGPEVSMRVDVSATTVQRGRTVTGRLEVRFGDKPANVQAVVCKLIRREKSQAQSHKDSHAETLVTERLEQRQSTANSLFASFEVRVPDDAIPAQSGARFTIAHELSVSLDVPWAKDPTIRIPITVV